MRIRTWMVLLWSLGLLAAAGGGSGAARAQEQQSADSDRHTRFTEHDRHEAREWYATHHDYFNHDEGRYWQHEWAANIRQGFVLSPEMQRGGRQLPRELAEHLGPVPHGWRYIILGDHVCLVDAGWRIRDVLNFGVGS